jgi:DNA-binding winged helix-turn-helix (wHTH) protein/Tol biopolymer transport system component
MASTTAQETRFGPFELDPASGELFKLGHKLNLRGQPIEVLSILLQRPGEVVTREELCKRLWPQDTFVDFEHSLNTAIKKLRQALDDDVETPRYIETLPKKGYRFVGRVEAVSNGKGVAVETAPTSAGIESSAPTEASSSIRPQLTKNRPWLWLLTAILVLLMSVAAAYWWYLGRKPVVTGIHQLTRTGHPKSSMFVHRPQTDGMRVYFDELTEDGWRAAQVPVNGGEVSYVDVAPLRSAVVAAISDDGSGLAVYDRAMVAAGNPYTSFWTMKLPNGPVQRIPGLYNRETAFVPGSKQLLFSKWPDDPKRLFLRNFDGTGELVPLSFPGNVSAFRVSPDRHIRFVAEGKTWDSRLDSSGLRQLSAIAEWLPAWSPDGHTSAYNTDVKFKQSNLWAVRELLLFGHLFRSRPVQLTNGPLSVQYSTFSRDGRQVFVSAELHRGELSVLDQKTGEWKSFLNGLSGALTDFSRDGQWMAYVSHPDATLWRSRVDGSEKLQLTTTAVGAVCNPRWSPDGRLIAFMVLSDSGRSYLIPADGGSPLLLGDGSYMVDPSWSPDGKSLLYGGTSRLAGGSSGIRIYDLSSKTNGLIANSERMFSPRWSLDGRYIGALSDDQTRISLYSFAAGNWRELKLPIASGTRIGWPAWSHEQVPVC